MPRDKEIKIREANNEKVMAILKEAFPDAKFVEFKFIPSISGIIVSELEMHMLERQQYLHSKLGDLYYGSYIRLMNQFEYDMRLEERDNPMD